MGKLKALKVSNMTRIEILRLKEDGSQEVLASGKLSGDIVELEGDPRFVEIISTHGILDRSSSPPQRLFPRDGERFMKALEPALSSGYLSVKETQEE